MLSFLLIPILHWVSFPISTVSPIIPSSSFPFSPPATNWLVFCGAWASWKSLMTCRQPARPSCGQERRLGAVPGYLPKCLPPLSGHPCLLETDLWSSPKPCKCFQFCRPQSFPEHVLFVKVKQKHKKQTKNEKEALLSSPMEKKEMHPSEYILPPLRNMGPAFIRNTARVH